MRLYRFEKAEPEIDVVVVTDGINSIKNVVITETPRGDTVGELEKLGLNLTVGVAVNEDALIAFAKTNQIKLTKTDQGIQSTDTVLNAGE